MREGHRLKFLIYFRLLFWHIPAMKKERTVLDGRAPRKPRKRPPRPSDERLRRLFKQAQITTERGKRAQFKERFIEEFYEGAP